MLSFSISQSRRLACSPAIVPKLNAGVAGYGSSGASGGAASVHTDYLELLSLVYKNLRELE